MLTYALIAAGGALGSMARAWAAVAVARATGPAFPWGTILINITGSFVIGFFGTITAADGRFAAPTDARAFVMIGICGGFTTFSSFSLQTLDLARDGRFAQALGNVGLSVVLCLASVAAGHYAAAGLNAGRVRAAAVPAGMGEAALVLLDRPQTAPGLLEAASRLAALEGGGRVEVLAWRTPPLAALLPSEEVLTADRAEELRAAREDWGGRLAALLAAWRGQAARRGIAMEVLEVEGELAPVISRRGRAARAVVVASRAGHPGAHTRQALHAALFDTEQPVLVVPPGWRPDPAGGGFGRVIAIAWKDDARAPLAVRAALPLLARAERVHVLRALPPHRAGGGLPAILAEHGIAAAVHELPVPQGSVGARLLAGAHECGADMMVMGAYAHGEWREAMLGGVTRHMLEHADIPLLMRH